MGSQTITLSNFGQSGVMPDVAPSLLPQTGFSYARNWRFDEGGHARVTFGYNNALATRLNEDGTQFTLDNPDANLTFMFTWELSDGNSIIAFDSNTNRMVLIENAGQGNLAEFNLSVEEDVVYALTYTTGDPGENQFTINNNGQIVARANTWTSDITSRINIGKELSISDISYNKPTSDKISSGTPTLVGDVLTITFSEAVQSSFFVDGVEYFLRFAEPYIHDNTGSLLWEGSEALGVPIFNNEVEAPWEFVAPDGNPFPKIQQLANWPLGGRCKSFTSFGPVLVAVGYTDTTASLGFEGSARSVAISNPITNAGTLPEWDFTNLDSQSQIIDLSLFSDGVLLSGYESNNQLIVNGTTDIISITDAGDGEYSGTKLEIGGGTLTKRTTVPIPNGFFAIGNGDMYVHDTSSYTQIGHGIYSDSWFNALDDSRLSEVQVVYDSRTRSVWIKTPTSETSQEIWIIGLDNNNALSILDDHQELNFMTWSAEGTPAESITWDSIVSQDWEGIEEDAWHDFPIVDLGDYRNRILSCGGSRIFVNDFGQTFNGRTIDAILEKAYFKLSANNSYSTFQFDRVIPWASGPDNSVVSVRVGGANNTALPINYSEYKNFVVGNSDKIDFRKQARWGAIAFRCADPGVELSGAEITVNSANRR